MYKFTKINEDEWKLEYNGQEYQIKKDLDKVVQLQQVDFEARVLMNKKLKEMGASIDDLQYETQENGKTIINDSQAQEVLEICKKEATYNKIKKMIQDITGLDILQIALDLGEEKFQDFIQEFVLVLSGNEEVQKKPSDK